jgi:hypothetical protein
LVPALRFGVASGAIIALGALGFTLQFGLSDTLNVAYRAFVTVGAFLGYFFVMHGAKPWIAMVIVAGLIGVLSVVYYEFLIRRLIRRGMKLVGLLIATLSAGIIIEYVVAFIAGPQAVSYGSEKGGVGDPHPRAPGQAVPDHGVVVVLHAPDREVAGAAVGQEIAGERGDRRRDRSLDHGELGHPEPRLSGLARESLLNSGCLAKFYAALTQLCSSFFERAGTGAEVGG